jgi:NhaA family Na+:H+ antiporter
MLGTFTGITSLPSGLHWKHLLGVGFLAGIGFTMSIFISLLAYNEQELINSSKIAIVAASLISGIIGFFWLKGILKKE